MVFSICRSGLVEWWGDGPRTQAMEISNPLEWGSVGFIGVQ